MYAAVIPAVKLPRDAAAFFDYAIPEDLRKMIRRGSWVRVPWRGKNLDGVVAAVRDAADIPAAKVKLLASSVGDLPEEWIAAVQWVAERTFVSMSTALHAFLPISPKRGVFSIAATTSIAPRRATSHRREVIRVPTPDSRDTLTIESARRAMGAGASTLIVVPHVGELSLAVRLRREFGDGSVVELHGGLSAGKLRAAWLRILAGPSIVIGTRPAVMAPSMAIGAIVILESDSPDLRQYDQNPRYDAREIARIRGDACGADVIFASHAPRIEEHALVREHGWVYREPEITEARTTITSAGPGNIDPISSVADAAESALQNGKKVLIFHNRRGSAGAVVCGDCRTVLRCPICGIALAVHGEQALHCHRCGTRSALPLHCPHCGGSELRRVGFGTEAISKLLTERFPESSILRMDADARETTHDAMLAADILIGTQTLIHDLGERWSPPIGLVVASSVDDLLMRPGFRVREAAWGMVRKLKDLAAADGAPLLLRTADPDNPKIAALLAPSSQMIDAELSDRRAAGYPPFADLYGIHVFGADERAAIARAEQVKRDLMAAASATRIVGPLRPSSPFVHGRWKAMLAVFIRNMTPKFAAALRKLPDDVIIDPNPDTLN